MTKKELTAKLAERSGSTAAAAKGVLDALIGIIGEELQAGQAVQLPHVGILRPADQAPRTFRHPRTGEEVKVGPRKRAAFKPSETLTRLLNS